APAENRQFHEPSPFASGWTALRRPGPASAGATSLTTIILKGHPAPDPAPGTDPTPPSRATAFEPAALAATAACVTVAPRRSAAIIAPAKLSPAPVRSLTVTSPTP